MSAPSTRLRLLIPTALSVALLSSGCGGSGDQASPSPSVSTPADATTTGTAPAIAPSSALDAVTATAAKGAAPVVKFAKTPFTADRGYRVITPGTGVALTTDSILNVRYALVSGKNGATLEASKADEATLRLNETNLLAGIRDTMVQQKAGAKVLIALPGSDLFGAEGNAERGIAATDTMVFYFDVVSARTPPKAASGTPVAPKPGLPTVTMGATIKDPATITVPKTAAPKTLIAQPLIVGTGPKVQKGQMLRVTYTGVTWANPGTPFDYSGRTEHGYADFQIGAGKLIKGWDETLVGQPVGSRLLLVVPPAKGYGAQGQGDIKPNDTLVFVLDILDAG